MSDVLYPANTGRLGCNFCGKIKIWNHHKPGIIWVLCKDCDFVRSKAGPKVEHPPLPNSRYTRLSNICLTGPHGYYISQDRYCWISGEKLDKFKNMYDLLDCQTEERPLYQYRGEIFDYSDDDDM